MKERDYRDKVYNLVHIIEKYGYKYLGVVECSTDGEYRVAFMKNMQTVVYVNNNKVFVKEGRLELNEAEKILFYDVQKALADWIWYVKIDFINKLGMK